MKKLASLVLAVLMLLVSSVAFADAATTEIKMGQALYAAHGTKCFTVATVAMQGDKIVGCYIDDFQFMAKDGNTGVPNSDADFGADFPADKVLASKKINSASYSANMADRGNATQTIMVNLNAIETFCTGKTVADLQAAISGVAADKGADVVSGCTLVDTVGYINAVIEAANSITAAK